MYKYEILIDLCEKTPESNKKLGDLFNLAGKYYSEPYFVSAHNGDNGTVIFETFRKISRGTFEKEFSNLGIKVLDFKVERFNKR